LQHFFWQLGIFEHPETMVVELAVEEIERTGSALFSGVFSGSALFSGVLSIAAATCVRHMRKSYLVFFLFKHNMSTRHNREVRKRGNQSFL